MALSDKNIIITPGIGSSTTDPRIDFRGADSTTGPSTISAVAYPTNNGTLSFEGTAGQLFSITNNLTSGSIFSVNDVSGIPSIDVNANGTVSMVSYGGSIGIGTLNPSRRLHVQGDVRITGALYDANNSIGSTNQVLQSVGTGVSWVNLSGGGGGTVSISTNTTNQAQYLTYAIGTGSTTGFGVTTSGLVFNPSTTRLGIGTTNPSQTLHVQGNALVTGISTLGPVQIYSSGTTGIVTATSIGSTVFYYGDGSGLTGIKATASPGGSTGQVQFNNGTAIGGASYFNYDSTNVRVGIGTSVPTARLSVANPTTGNSLLLVNDNLSDGSLFRVSNSAGSLLVDVDSGGTILFPTSGNVGIGTTLSSPTTKLHVDGDVTARFYYGDGSKLSNIGNTGIAITTQASSSTSVYPTLVSSTGVSTVGIATTGLSFITSTNTLQVGSAVTIYGSTGIVSATSFYGSGSNLKNVSASPGGSTGQVQFNNGTTIGGASYFHYDSTNVRVGIGTSVPTARLSVANPTTGNSLLLVNDNLSDGSLFRVSNSAGQLLVDVDSGGTILFPTSGNVGIGTTLSSPTTKLHVDGSVRITGALYDTNNSIGSTNQVLQSVGTGVSWVTFSGGGGGTVSISTNTTNQAQYLTYVTTTGTATTFGVTTSGLVFNPGTNSLGIGTTNPTYNLHVNGSLGATSKSFIINHPTKEGKKLQYGSLESPYHGIRLTGSSTIKTGKCVVELPEYIYNLVKTEDINIHITNIKHGKVLWVDEVDVANNRFIIMTEETSGEYDFYWDFTAIRKDIEDMIVEF